MRTRMRFHAVLGIGLLSAGAAACTIDVGGGDAIVKREERRFTVTGPAELDLRTFDGSIQLRSWDRDEVVVDIERRGRDEAAVAALDVAVKQDGNRIVVEAPEPKDAPDLIHIGPFRSASVSLVVTVPRKTNVTARTGDGSISVSDLSGIVDLSSGDGSIEARHIEGDLRIRTGDGAIDIVDAAGRVEANSGDGSVDLSGRLEALDVRTGDGSVIVDLFDGGVLKTDSEVNTGDGSITVRLPASFDAELEAHTGDGGVHVSGVPAEAVTDDRSSGERRDSLRATLGKGGRMLRLRSGDGSINVSR